VKRNYVWGDADYQQQWKCIAADNAIVAVALIRVKCARCANVEDDAVSTD
jgi:hypothetical protein